MDSEYPPVPLAYHRYLWIADLFKVQMLMLPETNFELEFWESERCIKEINVERQVVYNFSSTAIFSSHAS